MFLNDIHKDDLKEGSPEKALMDIFYLLNKSDFWRIASLFADNFLKYNFETIREYSNLLKEELWDIQIVDCRITNVKDTSWCHASVSFEVDYKKNWEMNSVSNRLFMLNLDSNWEPLPRTMEWWRWKYVTRIDYVLI